MGCIPLQQVLLNLKSYLENQTGLYRVMLIFSLTTMYQQNKQWCLLFIIRGLT